MLLIEIENDLSCLIITGCRLGARVHASWHYLILDNFIVERVLARHTALWWYEGMLHSWLGNLEDLQWLLPLSWHPLNLLLFNILSQLYTILLCLFVDLMRILRLLLFIFLLFCIYVKQILITLKLLFTNHCQFGRLQQFDAIVRRLLGYSLDVMHSDWFVRYDWFFLFDGFTGLLWFHRFLEAVLLHGPIHLTLLELLRANLLLVFTTCWFAVLSVSGTTLLHLLRVWEFELYFGSARLLWAGWLFADTDELFTCLSDQFAIYIQVHFCQVFIEITLINVQLILLRNNIWLEASLVKDLI